MGRRTTVGIELNDNNDNQTSNSGECVYNYPGPPKAFQQKKIAGITSELPEYTEPNICIVDVKRKY